MSSFYAILTLCVLQGCWAPLASAAPSGNGFARDFTCPAEDGFYATPGECIGDYYSCVSSTAYPMKCPGDSVFDPIDRHCVPLSQASCRTFTCPAEGGFYPIPGQCSGEYYSCIEGEAFLMRCPGNSIFDPVITVCVPPGVASCQVPATTPSSGTPTTTATTTRSTANTPITNPTAPITDRPTDASTTFSVSTTTPNTVSTTTPNIIVTTTTPRSTTTPNGGTFGPFRCPEAYGYYSVPGVQCGAQFYKCSNSLAYLMDCPATTIYNPDLQICDYPYSVPGCWTKTL